MKNVQRILSVYYFIYLNDIHDAQNKTIPGKRISQLNFLNNTYI